MADGATVYIGRFAPYPTGALHEGSLVAALASWLDARAHGGRWLVRIEDVDTPRCVSGAAEVILQQLSELGLVPDAAPVWQSRRESLYREALERLIDQAAAYPCACSRKDIEAALAAQGAVRPRHGELVYPGTCRHGMAGRAALARAWRFRTDGLGTERSGIGDPSGSAGPVRWHDRRLGAQHQDVEREVGDFVLKRADGLWAYQLAVVVDDAAQGISHVVRGEDLADNTARQVLLQRALGLQTPRYLHTALVPGPNGEKLSKQNGAAALARSEPLLALNRAAGWLGLPPQRGSVADALAGWSLAWADFYNPTGE